MMNIFWTTGTSSPMASDSVRTAVEAQSAAREANEAARDANERLDQLLLVTAAMWELVREKAGLTEEDLISRVAIIDARDGTADGKMTRTPIKCPKCNRTIFPKHRRCLYCGTPMPIESVFNTI